MVLGELEGRRGDALTRGHPTRVAAREKGLPKRKTAHFPGPIACPEATDSYCSGGSVARACNDCGKVFTGMMRRSPASLRACAALSPAGTRKTSAPASFTPIVF